jgi:nicotinamide-nucleotide amidase
VHIQIINTGRELMLGWRLNTHAQWLCQQLFQHGYIVSRQIAVDDSGPSIQDAIREALGRADLIITTGGLGPTSDDRTRDLVADLLGRALRQDPAVLAHITAYFATRKRTCPAGVHVQAQVPEGARVLLNAHGTAPGLAMEIPAPTGHTRPACLVMLPGPPRELQPMFRNQVLPLIQAQFPLSTPLASQILRSTGLGESMVEEAIGPLLQSLAQEGLEVGYCARPGEVDIQLLARGASAEKTVAAAEQIVRGRLGHLIFGTNDELLEEVVVRLLTARRQTLALAESCTGGCLAHRLTNVPGASQVFLGGLVTYHNSLKENFLGVRAETLRHHGAASESAALEMAAGLRSRTGADYAISVTGIAGPSGGSAEKPVGTVFVGLATAQGVQARQQLNPFDRETFKHVTSQQALEWLRQTILQPAQMS